MSSLLQEEKKPAEVVRLTIKEQVEEVLEREAETWIPGLGKGLASLEFPIPTNGIPTSCFVLSLPAWYTIIHQMLFILPLHFHSCSLLSVLTALTHLHHLAPHHGQRDCYNSCLTGALSPAYNLCPGMFLKWECDHCSTTTECSQEGCLVEDLYPQCLAHSNFTKS